MSDQAASPRDRVRGMGVLLIVVVLLTSAAVLARIVQLQAHPSPQLLEYAGDVTSQQRELGRRGALLDREGRTLAVSLIGQRLFVDPKLVRDPAFLAEELHRLAGFPPAETLSKLEQAPEGARYVVISHLLADEQALALQQECPRGAGLQARLVREYPHGDLAAALVGKVGFEHEGRLGAELTFDETLRGQEGRLVYTRDASRQALWVEPGRHETAAAGGIVQLSIDIVIQRLVEEELQKAVQAANAGGGRAVVVEPSTGELLAMTDILWTPERDEAWAPHTTDPQREAHPALGRFRCVTDIYEPGSTFKVFMWAVMTELGLAHIEETLDCHQGAWRVPYARRVLHDAFPKDELTWHEVLVHSSNIGMGQIAERMTPRQMQQAVRRFGFGRKTNIGLPGETAGIVTSPASWTRFTQTSVAMGQEIAVTPIQLARAFCSFARRGADKGTLPFLRLTKAPPDEAAPPRVRVLPPAVVDQAIAAMAEVGERLNQKLTRQDVEFSRHKLYGKSGTAQLPNWTEGGYYDDRYVSSFVAAAPLDEPRLVVLVVIDDPDRTSEAGHYGSSVAGPAVRAIVDRTLEYLGVPEPAEDESSI
ncbi:MAG: peptidoglycan D,D-transpeptidase FtsI family protein [Phycisphaerales bacterium JB038]